MRIGIDARELAGQPTGVGRYLAGLVRQWTEPVSRAPHDFVLYSHRPLTATPPCEVRLLPGHGGTLWEQRSLARALGPDRIDVLFSPAYSTPLLTSVPRVVALHDLSFVAHPEWFQWREGLRRRALARRAARVAAGIVTISEFSKSEIVQLLGTPPGRVHVIPPGIDPPPASPTQSSGASILFVGSIFTRRRIPDLLAAFSLLASRRGEVTLHLVGDNRSYPRQDIGHLIRTSTASTRIHWHEYVPEPVLHQLYAEARAFAFLSEYEGLGLTPLEALAGGIPCVLLETRVAREACGQAAEYVTAVGGDAFARALADALERVLFDDATRQRLLQAAPAALSRFSWDVAARDTLAVLEGAV